VTEFFRAVVLGLIQGLTEFLPISSSAHLRIFPDLFGWGDPGAAFSAVIQIGTELAVLWYFRKDIARIIWAWLRALWTPEMRSDPDARMGWYVIVGSIPIVFFGVLLKHIIETQFRNLWVIGTTLIVLGIILGIADRIGRRDKAIPSLTWRDVILYGFAQAAALIPGVSRSGATISMGRFLGYDREAATRFSFLLAIPAVVGAGLFELKDALTKPQVVIPGIPPVHYGVFPTLVATVVAFIVGYASIAWLLRFVISHSYRPFVIYRIVLGAMTLILAGFGVLHAGVGV
jgi:undecaprenyl-diphosphatase